MPERADSAPQEDQPQRVQVRPAPTVDAHYVAPACGFLGGILVYFTGMRSRRQSQ